MIGVESFAHAAQVGDLVMPLCGPHEGILCTVVRQEVSAALVRSLDGEEFRLWFDADVVVYVEIS
jgi:hypothetical protein